MNRAVLWHLQLCQRIADRLGYHLVGAHIASAIDALAATAISEDEISEMDLDREERIRLILELYAKNRTIDVGEDDSPDKE